MSGNNGCPNDENDYEIGLRDGRLAALEEAALLAEADGVESVAARIRDLKLPRRPRVENKRACNPILISMDQTPKFLEDLTEIAKPLEEGFKRVPVTLVIHTYEDVLEDNTDEQTKFFIEENHCLGNYLEQIQEDEKRATKRLGVPAPTEVCQLCGFAEAYIGHLPFPPHTELIR